MDLLVLLMLLTVLIAQSSADIIRPSTDGGSVNCVDRNTQAYGLNHQIQERPSEIPKMFGRRKQSEWITSEAHFATAKCPRGTIPMMLYPSTNTSSRRYTDTSSHRRDTDTSTREYGIATTGTRPGLYGARATMSVWNPEVEQKDELSISQLWITSGTYGSNDFDTIEVGWQVSPSLYKDNQTRLFIYWTSDAYTVTGCYNLKCSGFIQTSRRIVLGGVISPISVFGGVQFEITISVWKDKITGNWWLSVGSNNLVVGYWPSEIFSGLASHAEEVQFGGEIADLYSLGRHTTTDMGSGHFPAEGFSKASYFRNIEILGKNNSFQQVYKLIPKATDPGFYRIWNRSRDDWGTYFFYGGPGYTTTTTMPSASGVSSLALCVVLFYFSVLLFCII